MTLAFDSAGLAVLTRDNGRTTDLLILAEDFSAGIAERAPHINGRFDAWLAALWSISEAVPDSLIEHRRVRFNTLH